MSRRKGSITYFYGGSLTDSGRQRIRELASRSRNRDVLRAKLPPAVARKLSNHQLSAFMRWN